MVNSVLFRDIETQSIITDIAFSNLTVLLQIQLPDEFKLIILYKGSGDFSK